MCPRHSIFTMSKHVSDPLRAIDKTAGDEATDNDHSAESTHSPESGGITESNSHSSASEEITEPNATSLRQETTDNEDSLGITSGSSILELLSSTSDRVLSTSTLEQQQTQPSSSDTTINLNSALELESATKLISTEDSESTLIEEVDSGTQFEIKIESADEVVDNLPPPVLYAIEIEESEKTIEELLSEDIRELESREYRDLLREELWAEDYEQGPLPPYEEILFPSPPEAPPRREKLSETQTAPTKPTRRKATGTAASTTAILRKGLERQLGYHDPSSDLKAGNQPTYGTIGDRMNFMNPPPTAVYPMRYQSVGRLLSNRFGSDELLLDRDRRRGHYGSEDNIAYRKLSVGGPRVLIVDEDTRVEDKIQIHVHAMEKRLNRNNYSALQDILDEESIVTTPVGYEYSDRVLRRKHQIAWELALISPMMKKGIVETTIPIAATQYYTRKISFWHRMCSRFKLCFTCCWGTPVSDIEVESGLLTTESIEAFQQELNVMEYLGAQHKRTLERRHDILASSTSMKKLMSTVGVGVGTTKRNSR